LKAEIAECKVHIAYLDARVKAIAGESQGSLAKMQAFISVKKSVFEVKRYACTTETTALLSGWVPREEKDRVIDEIRKMKCSFYIEEKDPDAIDIPKEEVPVRLKHTPLLKPFGLLIDAYGLPRYGSVDPTLFVAVSFLLMFGAMFGDAGQGLVLVLASFFLGESRKEGIKQAAVLIRYCGLSATVFGLLYGSIFGIDFPSFWIKPMHDILQLFRISIYFGVGMISLGILLNVINALRDKDYIKAFLDKAGLVVGAMYWLAIAVVSKYLVSKTPASPIYLAFIGCGFVLIFLKPVITFIFTAHKEGNMLMLLMESLV